MRRTICTGAAALLLACAAGASAAGKGTYVAVTKMPFAVKVLGADDRVADGKVWTAAMVEVTNGNRYLAEVDLSCEAGNAAGFTWGLRGKITNLMPKEVRKARIVSADGGDPANEGHPSRVRCEVTGFSAGPLGWPVEFPEDGG